MLGFALLLFVLGSEGATAAKAADAPEQTAKNFYKWIWRNSTVVEIRLKIKQQFSNLSLVIKMVKESGAWKIDSVNNRELSA